MGEVIQFVPRPNPNRADVIMEQQAIGIVDYINGLVGHEYIETTGFTEMIPYHGTGIDGIPYEAPIKDPA